MLDRDDDYEAYDQLQQELHEFYHSEDFAEWFNRYVDELISPDRSTEAEYQSLEL